MKILCAWMTLFLAVAGVVCASSAFAQTFDERMDDWPIDCTINGTILAAVGSLPGDDQLQYFIRVSGGDDANIVSVGLDDDSFEESSPESWSDGGTVTNISTENEKLAAALDDATGVWISSPARMTREIRNELTRLEPQLRGLVQRGGVLLVSGSAIAALGKHQILGGQMLGDRNQASIGAGLNLIPDVVIQTDYQQKSRQRQLSSVVAAHPRCVGIGMDPAMTLVLRGRKIRALDSTQAADEDESEESDDIEGDDIESETPQKENGFLHFVTMANDRKPMRLKSIAAAPTRRANPRQFMIDLTAWRRDAIDRTLEVFPAIEPEIPFVENGTLFIVGGGGMPDGMMDDFIKLAGGKKAHLIYVPCSEQSEISRRDERLVEAWREKGVASAHVLHTKDRNQANRDQEFLEPLKNATGIFFGGGRQWNFSDSYYGTQAHRLMKEVLNRGGIIAGSSAGASIQGRYLARATPIGNTEIMATGYERGGLGFLSGVAIDQHFSQRRRQADMTSLVNRYPQLLGIGIDETTAIIVRKSVAEVVGKGDVYFYDRNTHVADDDPDHVALGAGKKYDLAKRLVVEEE